MTRYLDASLPGRFATWTFRTFGRFDTRTFRYTKLNVSPSDDKEVLTVSQITHFQTDRWYGLSNVAIYNDLERPGPTSLKIIPVLYKPAYCLPQGTGGGVQVVQDIPG